MEEFEDREDRIIRIDIEDEMKSAYIDYSMSVIVSRALPDVRDGLKPVHRRVLYAMNEMGNVFSQPTRKSAKPVGEVLANYHPHGDSSVYLTLVRLAQNWNMRYTLVDGQGNFGSIDGDSPAAMRYTEARLTELASEMLRDIEKDTVDMQNNFDDTKQEPTVLPTRFPNLLVNGASGIAVGMATNMAPHNLRESIAACIAYIDSHGEITIEELMEHVKAPDFPTGGIIYGYEGVKQSYLTGRGSITMRARCEIVEEHGMEKIIITEIPYQVNKALLVENIANLVNEKRLTGISNIADESSGKGGMRIVVDIKRDANVAVVLNHLYKETQLQSNFSANNIALVKGRPQLLTLKDIIACFVEHREEVVTRRCRFDLKKAEERAHILEGLLVAVDNIDEVIAIIRSSANTAEAMQRLQDRFSLSELQSRAIVDMRLRALTGLERDKLRAEYEELEQRIAYLQELLSNHDKLMGVVKEELQEISDKYGDDRKTEIIVSSEELNPEDFYDDQDMIITLSHKGYIKRTPLADFRSQSRGGKGAKGSATRDEDFIEYMISASMHATIMLFTQTGKVFWMRVFEIPEGTKTSRGRAIQNLLDITEEDRITTCIRIKKLNTDLDFLNSHYLFFATKAGWVKKTLLEAYSRPRTKGIRAIDLMPGDSVVSVWLTNGNCEILLANRNGRSIRFHEDRVRATGRVSRGVRGMRLDEGEDEIVGMSVQKPDEELPILIVSENGFGKLGDLAEYRKTNRGGKGVIALKVTEKTGKMVDFRTVKDDADLMIITRDGVAIRMPIESIPTIGRNTQGVKLIRLDEGESIASVCLAPKEEEEEAEGSLEQDDTTPDEALPLENSLGDTEVENEDDKNPNIEED